MAFIFNDNTPKKIKYNGNNVKKLIYNGVVVWLAKILQKITGKSPLTLYNSTGDDLVSLNIYGESEQDSTTGKNLLPSQGTDEVINGITWRVNKDGTITANGTATSTSVFRVIPLGANIAIPSGKYILNGCPPKGSGTTYKQDIFMNGGGDPQITDWGNSVYSGELSGYISSARLVIYGGTTVNNLIFKPMLSLTGGEYEPYTGGIASPNPEYPQVIENVGDKTKNILDSSTIAQMTINGITCTYEAETQDITFDGECTTNNTLFDFTQVIEAIANTTTATAYYVDGTINGSCNFRAFKASYGGNMLLNIGNLSAQNHMISVTSTETTNLPNISVRFNAGAVANNFKIKIMIANDTDTSYEPYGKYRIPVAIKGKNLFDKSKIVYGKIFDRGGNEISSQATSRSNYIRIKPNTTYTIRFKSNNPDAMTTRYHIFNENKEWISELFTIVADKGAIFYEKIFTTPNNCAYFVFNITGGYEGDSHFSSEIQLEEGTVATAYEPYQEQKVNIYLNEPLRRIGDVSDYIENGKIVRNIGKVVLNGSENWGAINYNNIHGYRTRIADVNTQESISKLQSTHFVQADWRSSYVDKKIYLRLPNYYNLEIMFDELADVNEFKNWLSQNPVIVQYPLATSTEETIELSSISTHEGINILSVDTSVQPSNVEVEYYKTGGV